MGKGYFLVQVEILARYLTFLNREAKLLSVQLCPHAVVGWRWVCLAYETVHISSHILVSNVKLVP